jgi:hypothetical protein
LGFWFWFRFIIPDVACLFCYMGMLHVAYAATDHPRDQPGKYFY